MTEASKKDEIMARLRTIINDDVSSWNTAWKEGVTPWDSGAIEPAFREIITSGEVKFPRQGKAFVPGCGAGYDVFYLAETLGLDATGNDSSEIAVKTATDKAHVHPPTLGSVTFECSDFFKLEVESDEDKFDLVYDCRFFVAIPPSRRPEWGSQMCKLVKPGGYLITLVYPLDPYKETGPPFYVLPEHYYEPLGDGWEKVVDRVPKESSESHVGRERMVVWRRR